MKRTGTKSEIILHLCKVRIRLILSTQSHDHSMDSCLWTLSNVRLRPHVCASHLEIDLNQPDSATFSHGVIT